MPRKIKDPYSDEEFPSDTNVRKRKKKDKETDGSGSDKEETPSPGKGKKDKNTKKGKDTKPQDDLMPQDQPSQYHDYKPKTKTVPSIFVTREIGKHFLPREKYLRLCLIEMFIYLAFLLTLILVASLQRTGNEYYLTRVMTKLFIERKFQVSDTNEVLSFNDINSVEHIWNYIKNLFLIWSDWSFYYSFVDKEASSNFGDMIFYENRYVGAIRMRQVRVKSEKKECVPVNMRKVVSEECYPAYSSSTEQCDGSPWGRRPTPSGVQQEKVKKVQEGGEEDVDTETPLSNDTVSEEPSLNTTNITTTTTTTTEKPATEDKTKDAWKCLKDGEKFGGGKGTKKPPALSTRGEISTYGGRGYFKDFLASDAVQRNDTLKALLNRTWIDRGTRAVILQFTTFNANENLFFTLKLLFEIPATGGVIPSYFVYSERLLPKGFQDTVVIGLFGVFLVFVVLYTVSEVFEMTYFKLHYFDYFWNLWDLIILILSYALIGFFVYSYFIQSADLKNRLKEHNKLKDKSHLSFDSYNYARESFITVLTITFFVAAVKLLKYMNFNHSMFQMQMTLSKATKDIICFSIMFFIVFITFAQLGHLVFGSQVRDFRSFGHSIFALLRTAVGDFDYHQIENVNHFLGPVFFFAYIFFIYFILVNMFLAIIIDTYSEVRTSIRDQSKELQMWDIILKLFKCFGKKGKKTPQATTAPPSHNPDVQNLLRRCGFTEMEIDLFFAKFDIPKDKDIPKEEMREKVLANFNMQPEAEAIKAQEEKEKDEIGEKLMDRIRLLEDNITDVNGKIDLIDTKIDNIQQIRARKQGQQEQEQK